MHCASICKTAASMDKHCENKSKNEYIFDILNVYFQKVDILKFNWLQKKSKLSLLYKFVLSIFSILKLTIINVGYPWYFADNIM